jgi:type I restriction enzyme M protein
MVVPLNVLFTSSPGHRELRERLLQGSRVVAVVKLPDGTFRPQADIGAALVLLAEGGPTRRVWFTELGEGGVGWGALASARRALDSSGELRAPSGWWDADAEAIVSRDSLLPAAHREEAAPVVEADPTVLIGEVRELESDLQRRLASLAQLIDG